MIEPSERRTLDRALAARLDGMGEDPWSSTETMLVDVESGEAIHLLPIREHWAFSGIAKARAAEFVKVFTAFSDQHGTANLHAFVLRPEFQKAGLGELKKCVLDVGRVYGCVIDKARAKGIARPVAMFIHIRWDANLALWDVHIHAVIDVPPENVDKVFLRLTKKFSTPKHIQTVKSIGAWTNYSASWIVDHRRMSSWPDTALGEFWNLGPAHLMRKGGDFATFAATLKGKDVRWEGNRVVVAEKEPPLTRQDAQGSQSPIEGLVSYAYVRIGGRRRRCAIYRYRREDGGRQAAAPATFTVPETGHHKPTTSTRPFPPPPKPSRIRLPRQMALWATIWPYGTEARPPRPIQRRLAQDGLTAPKRPRRLLRRRDRT